METRIVNFFSSFVAHRLHLEVLLPRQTLADDSSLRLRLIDGLISLSAYSPRPGLLLISMVNHVREGRVGALVNKFALLLLLL